MALTEREWLNETRELLAEICDGGQVPLESSSNPVSSPLKGWHDGKSVYIKGQPDRLEQDGNKTIRIWDTDEYQITLISRVLSEPKRTIVVESR